MPPITAIASGCSICEPAPKRERQRNHAGDRGQRGHHDGPQAALARVDHAVLGATALGAELLIGVEQQNAVLRHDADHHDQAHERRDVEGGAGDEQRQEDAEVESSADAMMAIGAAKAPNSNSSTVNTSTIASTSTISRSWNDFCCSA